MRVLVIEDDVPAAQSLELMLKSESFNVYTTKRACIAHLIGHKLARI